MDRAERYLMDPSARPDPFVAELERALASKRLPTRGARYARRARGALPAVRVAGMAAAAAVVLWVLIPSPAAETDAGGEGEVVQAPEWARDENLKKPDAGGEPQRRGKRGDEAVILTR